ncbi:hypothetical protein WIMU106979_24880 [Williamsia muralis]
MPHIGQAGSLLGQIAWRSANAVFIAEGAPSKTMYPQTAREKSSMTVVNQGLDGLPLGSLMRMSSSVWSTCHRALGCSARWRKTSSWRSR